MADWVRNTVMLTVTGIWALYILVSVFTDMEVPAVVWGLPGAVYFALNPTWKKPGRNGNNGLPPRDGKPDR